MFIPSAHWQLVWNPIAACEQLFIRTVVTSVVTGLRCVWGSMFAACSVSVACTESMLAMVMSLVVMSTGRLTEAALLYA